MENFGKFMTFVIAIIIAPVINGFVAMKLWAWFVVPTFDLQELHLVNTIGLLMLVGFVRAKKSEKEETDNFWKNFVEKVIFVIIIAGFALFAGWIVTLFM